MHPQSLTPYCHIVLRDVLEKVHASLSNDGRTRKEMKSDEIEANIEKEQIKLKVE